MSEPTTELVAMWSPEGEPGYVAFLFEKVVAGDPNEAMISDIVDAWSEDDIEGVIGTIVIERKPKGWVESLPEHAGW